MQRLRIEKIPDKIDDKRDNSQMLLQNQEEPVSSIQPAYKLSELSQQPLASKPLVKSSEKPTKQTSILDKHSTERSFQSSQFKVPSRKADTSVDPSQNSNTFSALKPERAVVSRQKNSSKLSGGPQMKDSFLPPKRIKKATRRDIRQNQLSINMRSQDLPRRTKSRMPASVMRSSFNSTARSKADSRKNNS